MHSKFDHSKRISSYAFSLTCGEIFTANKIIPKLVVLIKML